MDELLGTMMGRYRLDEKIGEGGMAAVYKAMDTVLERWVAIKVITGRRQASDQFLKRFEREAKALAKLSHPGIMDIHDYGDQDGHPYIVMEYLPNGTLKQYMGRPMNYQQAARLLQPIAEALAYAHKKGIVHRDIKPANILFSQHNKPMIGDFGIVKVVDTAVEEEALTQVGTGIGTPYYMSPEQGKGEEVDTRTDVYALGVVFYELVAGRRPYEAPTPTSFFFQQMTEPLPDPRRYAPDIPQEVVEFISKTLSIHLEQRVQSMDEFAKAMSLFATGIAAKPRFEEAPTRMATREDATMLESKQQTPARTTPEIQRISTPPSQSNFSTPSYDSSNNVPSVSTAYPTTGQNKPKKKKTWIIFVVLGGLAVIAVLCIAGIAILNSLLNTDDTPDDTAVISQENTPITMQDSTSAPTEAPTSTVEVQPTDIPAVTSQINSSSRMSTEEFFACIEKAGYADQVDISENLVGLVCDNFDDNRYNWLLQPIETDYVSAQTSIVDGVLRMQMTSKDAYTQYWQWVDDVLTGEDIQLQDMIVFVKMRRVQGPNETLIGLDYRETEDDRFYSFTIYENSQNMTLEIFDDEYKELANANTPNWVGTDWHMLTLAITDTYHYLGASDLNDVSYGEIYYSDSAINQPGELSIWVGAVDAGQTVVYEIDDLLIVQVTN